MKKDYLFVDAHQDMAWNMLCFERDYTQRNQEIRDYEKNTQIPSWNQDTILGWDVYQKAKTAIVFSTLFSAPVRYQEGDWDKFCYKDFDEARRMYLKNIEAYHRLLDEHAEKFTLIKDHQSLTSHLSDWELSETDNPVGLVFLMEGAEAVRHPEELEEWWDLGLRIIGPAWTGTRFCGGTKEPGGLSKDGYALLDGMADHGFVLDISHMDQQAVLETFDHYSGQIMASHANPKGMMKASDSNRFLSDRVIEGLIERDGVIGVVIFNAFLKEGWKNNDPRDLVSINDIVAHIDYICQIAGDAKHVGIGSDADGGFGLQSCPIDFDTLADVQKLVDPLEKKGYSDEDIAGIMGENWIRFLKQSLADI
jgi:membrane dipeptidase